MKNALYLLFFTFSAFAQTSDRYQKLTCKPSNQDAVVEIHFPRLIDPLKPFVGFPEIFVQVTVQKEGMGWTYLRNNVLVIPEQYPVGLNMRGQSSDSLYLRLSPQIIDGVYQNRYFGQLFVNDHDSERRAYFRFIDSDSGPGIICTGN